MLAVLHVPSRHHHLGMVSVSRCSLQDMHLVLLLLQRQSAFWKQLQIWQDHCSSLVASCPDGARHGTMGLRWTAVRPPGNIPSASPLPGIFLVNKCIERCTDGCAAHAAPRMLMHHAGQHLDIDAHSVPLAMEM